MIIGSSLSVVARNERLGLTPITTQNEKGLFRAHRGLPTDHARRAAEWFLNSLTAAPHNPWNLVQSGHYSPSNPAPQTHTFGDEQVGPTLGTEFSWDDGNGIQHGWGGRSR